MVALSRVYRGLRTVWLTMPPPLHLPLPTAPPAVEPGPASLGASLGIARDGAIDGGVEPIFFAGPPWKGRATKVFGYIGLPAGLQPGETCPAMVLLHGGGGTAFDVWVELWNARGYAAITFDQCGDIPSEQRFGDGAPHARHPDGACAPPGWPLLRTLLGCRTVHAGAPTLRFAARGWQAVRRDGTRRSGRSQTASQSTTSGSTTPSAPPSTRTRSSLRTRRSTRIASG